MAHPPPGAPAVVPDPPAGFWINDLLDALNVIHGVAPTGAGAGGGGEGGGNGTADGLEGGVGGLAGAERHDRSLAPLPSTLQRQQLLRQLISNGTRGGYSNESLAPLASMGIAGPVDLANALNEIDGISQKEKAQAVLAYTNFVGAAAVVVHTEPDIARPVDLANALNEIDGITATEKARCRGLHQFRERGRHCDAAGGTGQ